MYLVFEKAEEPNREAFKAVVISNVVEFGQVEIETEEGRDWVWKLKLENLQAYECALRQTGWEESRTEQFTLYFEPDTQDVAWFFRLNYFGARTLEFGHWRLLNKVAV